MLVASMVADMIRIRRSDGGRHDQDTEVGAHNLLGFACKGKCNIRSEVSLVKFVEDNQTDAFQCRVLHQHACQDAFREHFDAGVVRYLCLESHPIADGSTHGFAEQGRHAFGNLSGCQTSGLQHQDLPTLSEIVQQDEG